MTHFENIFLGIFVSIDGNYYIGLKYTKSKNESNLIKHKVSTKSLVTATVWVKNLTW